MFRLVFATLNYFLTLVQVLQLVVHMLQSNYNIQLSERAKIWPRDHTAMLTLKAKGRSMVTFPYFVKQEVLKLLTQNDK